MQTISVSVIELARSCEYAYVLRLRGAPREATRAMLEGIEMHRAFELIQRCSDSDGQPLDLATALSVSGLTAPSKKQIGMIRVLLALIARMPFGALIEERFRAPITPDLELHGVFDRVNTLDDGSVEIVDWKTGWFARPLPEVLQSRAYAWAASVLYRQPVSVRYHYLQREQTHVWWPSEASRDLAAEELVESAAVLRRLAEDPGTASVNRDSCARCLYRNACDRRVSGSAGG